MMMLDSLFTLGSLFSSVWLNLLPYAFSPVPFFLPLSHTVTMTVTIGLLPVLLRVEERKTSYSALQSSKTAGLIGKIKNLPDPVCWFGMCCLHRQRKFKFLGKINDSLTITWITKIGKKTSNYPVE